MAAKVVQNSSAQGPERSENRFDGNGVKGGLTN